MTRHMTQNSNARRGLDYFFSTSAKKATMSGGEGEAGVGVGGEGLPTNVDRHRNNGCNL